MYLKNSKIEEKITNYKLYYEINKFLYHYGYMF